MPFALPARPHGEAIAWEGRMKEMHDREDVDAALGEETAILFKHSTRCPISAHARGEMERFMERHPDAPVYTVDVNDDADVSRYLAEKTGIEHHSPQVIVTRRGQPEWDASHFDVRADALASRLSG
jgi:bacillithiol system protein YtxJ